jgi:glycosyltransferase involved in cell wall biosynthesis
LADCDEIIVFDMGSTDNPAAIATKYGAVVRQVEQVAYHEKIWGKLIGEAKNDWIVFLDPDEVYPEDIFRRIGSLVEENDTIGLFSLPWQFYFLGKPLKSTVWGGKNYKARVFHRNRVLVSSFPFGGVSVKPEYKTYVFPYEDNLAIKHYWVDSLSDLFKKHWRYIKNEGAAWYNKDRRFRLKKMLFDTYHTLRKNLIDLNGLHDGWAGIFLSFFHAWYVMMCHLSLLYFQIFKAGKLDQKLAA